MKIIVISNQRGGAGKTTTAATIGQGLSKRGYKVLFIDLDGQGSLTSALNGNRNAPGSRDLLLGTTAADCIQKTAYGDLMSASPYITGIDLQITSTGKEYRLAEGLKGIKNAYDYIIIDTPPVLSLSTINAFTAADSVIIPTQTDKFSLESLGQLYGTIETVRRYTNAKLTIDGIVITRYKGRALISQKYADMLNATAQELNTRVFAAKIRECISIVESQALNKSVFEYAPRSNAAADYNALIDEIIAL